MSSVPQNSHPDVADETSGVAPDVTPMVPPTDASLTPEMIALVTELAVAGARKYEADLLRQTPTEYSRYVPRPAAIAVPQREPYVPLAIVTGLGWARVQTLDMTKNEWGDVNNADVLEQYAAYVVKHAGGTLDRWGHYAVPPWLAAHVQLSWEPIWRVLGSDEVPPRFAGEIPPQSI